MKDIQSPLIYLRSNNNINFSFKIVKLKQIGKKVEEEQIEHMDFKKRNRKILILKKDKNTFHLVRHYLMCN